MIAFRAESLLTRCGILMNPLLLVEGGRVVEISAGEERAGPVGTEIRVVDLGAGMICPGYLDLHVHGGGGYDVMGEDPGALPAIGQLLARHGVTSYLPTTVTAPMDATLRALERLADAVEKCKLLREKGFEEGGSRQAGRAQPLGIHLEGPFISHVQRGVHPEESLLLPTVAAFDRLWEASRGQIRMVTLAPELEGAMELIETLAGRRVSVALGHSDADFSVASRAIEWGARHCTHVFNAMRPLGHRDPGIIGAVLGDSRVSIDLIADGIHLDPAIVRLVARVKGAEKLVLITDCTSAAGMPDGRYMLGSIEVTLTDGRCLAGGKLAGSVLTMDAAVRNLARFAEWEIRAAVGAATWNPAGVLGDSNKGELKAGADADFIVLNRDGEILRTFIGGEEAGEFGA